MDHSTLNRLYRYAVSLTGERDDAYDLLQQAVERYLKRRKQVEKPLSYIMRSIRHLFYDQLRHRHLQLVVNHQLQDRLVSPEDIPRLDDVLIDREDIEGLLQDLTHHESELLYLWVVEEYTAQEIADLREVPRGTVLSQIHRLKKKLKARQHDVRKVGLYEV